VHAQLRVLPGRDAHTRAALSNLVLDALEATLPRPHLHTQLCVEVDEMDARSYAKRVFDAQSD
jgi:5-carboxymethyl-2-hydroxymuconate isomerase